MKERIRFIDISRGIAIILIVLGHIIVYSEHCREIYKFLYSFHISLFFIISGYTFKIPKDYGFFIKNKFLRIMVPYFLWSILFLIPYIIFGQTLGLKSASSSSFNILIQLKNIIYGNGNNFALKQNSSLWFFPALFTMEIIFAFILRLLDKNKKNIVDILFGLFLFIIGYISTLLLNKVYLPWGINTTLQFGIFFYFGYLIKKMSILKIKEKINLNIIFVCLILGLMACFFNNENVSAIDYKYGNYELAILSGLFLSLVVILCSILINESKILEYIGKNTMGILILHKPILIIFQSKLGIITKLLKDSNIIVELLVSALVLIITLIISLIGNYFLKKLIPFCIGEKYKT